MSGPIKILLTILCFVVILSAILVITNNLRKDDHVEGQSDTREKLFLGQLLTDSVNTTNQANATLVYHLYLPKAPQGKLLPVLVLINVGLRNNSGGGPFRTEWKEFADRNSVALLFPVFNISKADWSAGRSIQNPELWAGAALDEILEKAARSSPIDRHRLFLIGFSYGAQFSHRYALLNPSDCRAVVAFAAGSYSFPDRYIETEFFIGVGDLDIENTNRLKKAQEFVGKARIFQIRADLHIEEGIRHRVTSHQTEQARKFFEETLMRENESENR